MIAATLIIIFVSVQDSSRVADSCEADECLCIHHDVGKATTPDEFHRIALTVAFALSNPL